jgi:hypothetical protein
MWKMEILENLDFGLRKCGNGKIWKLLKTELVIGGY